KNLLENQARLVIDLAISGKHCGARYMGEAMTSYNYLYPESTQSDTLKNSLIKLLGNKRKAVAHAQVQRHFGQQNRGADTHSYSLYMDQMGKTLAIPGTENVVEHLGGFYPFDTHHYLREFFKEYSETAINDAVQEKIKNSQHFREQVIDWLKGQSRDWRPENQPESNIVHELEQIVDGAVDTSEEEKLIRSFEDLLSTLKTQGVKLPSLGGDWETFIQDLMALSNAKEWFKNTHGKDSQPHLELMKERVKFISKLTRPLYESILRKCVPFKEQMLFESFKVDLTGLAKIEAMRRILPLDPNVCMRILNKEADLRTVVDDYYRKSTEVAFIQALGLDNIHEEGLPPLIIKWLLYAHQVFVPEKPEEIVDLQAVNINPGNLQIFLNKVGPERDKLPSENKNAALDTLFDEAFQENPNEVSFLAEQATSSKAPFYPNWKRVVYIDVAKAGADFFSSPLLQIATSIFTIYKIVQFMKKAYAYNKILVDRAKLYLEKNASSTVKSMVLKTQAVFLDYYRWILKNRLKLFIYGLMAKAVLRSAPFDFTRRLARRLKPGAVLPNLFSEYNFFFLFGLGIFCIGYSLLNQIISSLETLSNQSQQEQNRVSRKISYSLWRANAGYV
ncbi:MAG: hypothetical protein HRU43_07565, partial [Simkaniaceae bacterium]|nr:hypothetical protein [Simkaniaceae bacterium]